MKKKLQSIVLAFMMALTVAVAPVGGVITGNGNVAVIEAASQKTIKTFTINSLYNSYRKVTGKGLRGAKVKAYSQGRLIGSATVRSNSTYSISIPKQPAGRTVTVKISKSGYKTRSKSVTVKKDRTSGVSTKYVYVNGGKFKIENISIKLHMLIIGRLLIKMTEKQAKARGYRACKRCW